MTLIREPLLRGVMDVSALLFGGPNAADDALAHWGTGAALLRTDDGSLVVRLPHPIAVRCELGRGLPLIATGGRLVSLPLDQAQLEDTPAGAIVRLHHGRLAVDAAPRTVDPAVLLDLNNWHLERPLDVVHQRTPGDEGGGRLPPPEPQLALEPNEFDTLTKLGHSPKPTRRDRRQWKRLQEPAPSRVVGTSASGVRGPATSPLLEWLHKRRQRKYLDDLTRLFAAGDLDAALRKAIPFGGDNGPQRIGTPRARDSLQIKPHRTPSSGVVSIEAGLRAELDHRYRAAFARLDSEGRTLDAAFVLADLLNRTEEACHFLELKGEIQLAAELAEARTNDHAEVVRLWWRAGQRDRAVAIARRHGCFAAAISRLDRRGDRPEADSLRRSWMAQLLAAGDIVGAYDVGAKVEDETAVALRRRLIELATEQGGPLRARMLARQLRAGEVGPHRALGSLLTEPSAAHEREILAEELTAARTPVDHPQVVRHLVRRLLAERSPVDRKVIDAAVTLTGDPVLRTDLPPLGALERRRALSPETAWIEVDATDRGQLQVKDARLLPDGRLIAAVDGIGIRLVKPTGRIEADLDVPADVLIASDNGLRVLALRALGDGVFGVASIAIPERRVRPLGEVAATRWADTYDGANWFLANREQLWMLDMLADGPVALWRQAEHGEPILAVSRAPGELAVASIVSGRGDTLPWTIVRHYRLPALVELDTRKAVPAPGFALLPSGEMVVGDVAAGPYRARVEGAGTETLTAHATKESLEAPVAVIRLAGASRAVLHVDNASLVVTDDCGRVEAVDLTSGARRSLRLTL